MLELPTDWSAFIALLRSHRVRFLIVGAHALAAHGRPRATQDLDLFVDPTPANAVRLGAALREFGFVALSRVARRFARPFQIASLGREPQRIDLLTGITGVTFREAWKDRVDLQLAGGTVAVLGRASLIKNKSSTGRAKDALDLELLREVEPVRRRRAVAARRKAPSKRRSR